MLFSNLYIIKKSFIKRLLGQYWDRAVQYFVEKLFFVYAICGKAHLTYLRICDCGIGPRICEFAICGLLKKVCLPTSALCWFPVHIRQYGGFFGFNFFMYDIQNYFICRPSDSKVSEDAGVEPRTVATVLWHWQPDALTSRKDLIHPDFHLFNSRGFSAV